MAVQIYSDNSDEVTGATLEGGETCGTWTKAGELLGVTGGRRQTGRVVAEMPTAGPISGSSVNPNPTTPVNSVSLTFRFVLRASRSDSSPRNWHPNWHPTRWYGVRWARMGWSERMPRNPRKS